jgi:hypothetical protein
VPVPGRAGVPDLVIQGGVAVVALVPVTIFVRVWWASRPSSAYPFGSREVFAPGGLPTRGFRRLE